MNKCEYKKNVNLGSFIRLVVFFCSISWLSFPANAHGDNNLPSLIKNTIDAVVNISSTEFVERKYGEPMLNAPKDAPFKDFFEEFFNKSKTPVRRTGKVTSLGSGFVIDASGLIVTNRHIIKDENNIMVYLSDGTMMKATLIGSDHNADIAVLKVKPKKTLTVARFGGFSILRLGASVIAIERFFSPQVYVSFGVVSGVSRVENVGAFGKYIQTDARIGKGGDGGPLMNMQGEVIGINISGSSLEKFLKNDNLKLGGIGFAIPADIARPIVLQIIKDSKTKQ